MKAKKEDICLRTVSRHFLGGSFLFVGTLVKKNLIAKILWTDGESRRERAKAEEFLRF
jgi:hypothetical protein